MIRTLAAGFLIVWILPCVAHGQLIASPSLETVAREILSDDSFTAARALIAVQMDRLPLAEQVRATFEGENSNLAWSAFLAAGGDEQELVRRMQQALKTEDDLVSAQIATALLFSNSSRGIALRTLVRRSLHSDLDSREVLKCLGGELSRQGMEMLLEELIHQETLPDGFDVHDFTSFSFQTHPDQWPRIKQLLHHSDQERMFLAALWLVNGDFDPVESNELLPLLDDPDPVIQAAAATLLMRRESPPEKAEKSLISALQGKDLLARQIAIAGVGTLPGNLHPWLVRVMPSLLENDAGTRWIAARIVNRISTTHQPEVISFLNDHLEQIPVEILLSLTNSLTSPDSPEAKALWMRLAAHPHPRMQAAAIRNLVKFPSDDEMIELFLASLSSPSVVVREKTLDALRTFKIPPQWQQCFTQRARSLLLDRQQAQMHSAIRIEAAHLLWQSESERPAILALATSWLASSHQQDISDGLELAKRLGGDSQPLWPLVFERATHNWLPRERARWIFLNGQPASLLFLLTKITSPHPQERGTALQLMATGPGNEQAFQRCLTLLDDEATYQSYQMFEKPVPVSVGKAAAGLLAYWARTDHGLAQRLLADGIAFPKLKSLLPPERLDWIVKRRPGLKDIEQGQAKATYWDVVDVLSESEQGNDWSLRIDNSAGRASPELLLEVLELSERVLPAMWDDSEFLPETIFEDLEKSSSIDERLKPVLAHWIEAVPLLSPETRLQAARALIKFQPDRRSAQTLLRLEDRALDFSGFGWKLSP